MGYRFRLFGFIFRIVAIVAAAALCISYISVFISPALSTIPLFFGLFFIPLVILNILLLVIALIARSNAGWITFIFLLPSLFFIDLFVRWGEDSGGQEGRMLKICSYNVGTFSLSRKYSQSETIVKIKEFIESNSPDIVCIQDYYVKENLNLLKSYDRYPYMYPLAENIGRGYIGNVILSKFPITKTGRLAFDHSSNQCIYADIDHLGDTLRIYNAHLESNSISFTSLIKKFRERDNLPEEISKVHDKMALSSKKRASQVEEIISHSNNSPYESIICGDFNDTPVSYTYRNLVRNKKDSFKESGKGFSATYSTFWPLLRIDYILYPERFGSVSHSTRRVDYSDHYPIISEIIIP